MDRVSLSAMLRHTLLWAVLAGATTFPTTVEVDFIFPRNETYAPSRLFPVVLAFKNTAVAPSMILYLSIGIWDTTDGPRTTLDGGPIDLKQFNFTSSDPVYVYTYLDNFDTTRGHPATTHMLTWEIGYSNCSSPDRWLTTGRGVTSGDVVEFTIQNNTQQPNDFVAALASNERCADRPSLAFNLSGTLPDGNSSCAVFSDAHHDSLVAGKPCAVQASPAAASSIMANITTWACEAELSGVTGCPPKSAAGFGKLDIGYTAVLGGLAVFLAGLTLLQGV